MATLGAGTSTFRSEQIWGHNRRCQRLLSPWAPHGPMAPERQLIRVLFSLPLTFFFSLARFHLDIILLIMGLYLWTNNSELKYFNRLGSASHTFLDSIRPVVQYLRRLSDIRK